MNKSLLITMFLLLTSSIALGAEHPLCQLPYKKKSTSNCANLISSAKKLNDKISLINTTTIPNDINVGAVYLQAITMAPYGMMRDAKQSDIHLELDIHAKSNLKSSGFTPGDWLPNAQIFYTITKLGKHEKPIMCGYDKVKHKITKDTANCLLMPMVASDGAHYGDNVRLEKAGIYLVEFKVKSTPNTFGWHIDTDSKILTTAYVDYQFTQKYIFEYTGVGKKGGY